MDSILPILKIVIDDGTQKEEATVASTTGGKTAKDPDESSSGIDGAEKALKRLVAPATIRHYAGKLAQNYIGTVEMRTGAREYEQQLQFGKQIIDSGISLGMSIVAGASMGGPVGAIVATGLFAVNKAIDIGQSFRELDIKENREDISLGFARMRAGFVDPVAGRRE